MALHLVHTLESFAALMFFFLFEDYGVEPDLLREGLKKSEET